MSTKQKILDTAERLIAEQGFAATSLRQIISEAGVNLAAVHYHFGSKEDLLDELITRKAEAVNQERHHRIDRCEAEAGSQPIPVEKLLAAFFEPMIEAGTRNPQFVKLMGRLYGEGLIPALIEKHFQAILNRFVEALHRSRPELSEGELLWRMQFTFGAMSQAVCGWDAFPPGFEMRKDPADFRLVMRRLMTFLIAGLRAPATSEAAEEHSPVSAGHSPNNR
ncbi:MAG: TetR family transcriptional regulator [Terriglobia bacterium]|nr:MAG: TetR family transcriptional regulator [Terriglobia bacterium]